MMNMNNQGRKIPPIVPRSPPTNRAPDPTPAHTPYTRSVSMYAKVRRPCAQLNFGAGADCGCGK